MMKCVDIEIPVTLLAVNFFGCLVMTMEAVWHEDFPFKSPGAFCTCQDRQNCCSTTGLETTTVHKKTTTSQKNSKPDYSKTMISFLGLCSGIHQETVQTRQGGPEPSLYQDCFLQEIRMLGFVLSFVKKHIKYAGSEKNK